jgi:hypothetical protein
MATPDYYVNRGLGPSLSIDVPIAAAGLLGTPLYLMPLITPVADPPLIGGYPFWAMSGGLPVNLAARYLLFSAWVQGDPAAAFPPVWTQFDVGGPPPDYLVNGLPFITGGPGSGLLDGYAYGDVSPPGHCHFSTAGGDTADYANMHHFLVSLDFVTPRWDIAIDGVPLTDTTAGFSSAAFLFHLHSLTWGLQCRAGSIWGDLWASAPGFYASAADPLVIAQFVTGAGLGAAPVYLGPFGLAPALGPPIMYFSATALPGGNKLLSGRLQVALACVPCAPVLGCS